MLTQKKLNEQYAKKQKLLKKMKKKYFSNTSFKFFKCEKSISDFQAVRDLPQIKV